MTLILKMTSHKTASQYIMLQDFAFKQALEFALSSSSCYKKHWKQGVILLNYCRSLKATPTPKIGKIIKCDLSLIHI